MTDRVEPRLVLVGRGIGATPENIEGLQKRSRQMEKLTRKKPKTRFGDLVASDEGESEEAKEPDPTPKGPRPGLVHPSQRQVYGREGREDESVILKG
ncbi:MAG: hypothetical protein AAFQ82_07180 [Myxococcota bacterium]